MKIPNHHKHFQIENSLLIVFELLYELYKIIETLVKLVSKTKQRKVASGFYDLLRFVDNLIIRSRGEEEKQRVISYQNGQNGQFMVLVRNTKEYRYKTVYIQEIQMIFREIIHKLKARVLYFIAFLFLHLQIFQFSSVSDILNFRQ